MINEEQRYWQERDFTVELIKQLPLRIFWKNREGVYLGCNEAFAGSFGLSPADIIGRTDYDLSTTKEESDAYLADDKEVMNSLQPKLNIEESQTLPDGKRITLLTNKVPLLTKAGEVMGILGIYSDITERKKSEEELKIAKEIAESANRTITQFIQNMQHDFRISAGGVWQLIEKLAQQETIEEKKKILLMAEASSRKLLNICNKVVAFDRAEKNIEPIQFTPNDIREFVSEIIALNEPVAYNKMISLKLNVEPDVPAALLIDEHRLERILINLLGNALKFTPEGGAIFLNVRVASNENGKMIFEFEVKDTGIGFDENDKERIFEKFVRLNPSNEGTYEGTGLGLSIVKKFVIELGGTTKVSSQKGHGSTFTVYLPFDITEEAPQPASTVIPVNTMSTEVENIRLLFIEDDRIAMMVGLENLNNLGYCVDTAIDVASAKECLMHHQYQLVLSDIGLPDGKGTDIVAWVKSHPLHLNANTPFLALTAHTSPEVVEAAFNSGFLEVINKPFPVDVVQKLIIKHIPSLTLLENKRIAEAIDELPVPLNDIIDLNMTLNERCGGNQNLLKKLLHIAWETLPSDFLELEKLCRDNDIERTRKLLHRLTGTFAYCVLPRLQEARNKLHEAVRQANKLSDLEPLYKDLFKELDIFLMAVEKLKREEKI